MNQLALAYLKLANHATHMALTAKTDTARTFWRRASMTWMLMLKMHLNTPESEAQKLLS
jgi:hypothetical protein